MREKVEGVAKIRIAGLAEDRNVAFTASVGSGDNLLYYGYEPDI